MDIPDLQAWWDASAPAGALDGTGTPLVSWDAEARSVADRSGHGAPLLRYATAAASAICRPAARVAGLLGGIGALATAPQTWSPALDADIGWQTDAVQIGAGVEWSCLLVWSRPNWKQGITPDTAGSVLLSTSSGPVLSVQGRGGAGQLVLFPGPAQTVLRQGLARRHTHSVLLCHTPQRGVDAWVDGQAVGTALPCPLAQGEPPPLLFLHDGTSHGAAQCWLHEAAVWSRALSGDEASVVGTYLRRWPSGARKGVSILVNGQSNAINYALNDGAALLLAKGLAWHLGAIAYNAVARIGAVSYTMAAGHGLYAALGSYPGDFLHDPGNGSAASGWALGADGLALGQALAALPAEDLADIRAILWPWNETDSLRAYAEKATFSAAAERFVGLLREMLGDPGNTVPLVWWNAIPYGGTEGIQMHREVVASLAATPSANVVIGNPQTSDSNPRGSSWDPQTGIFTGGDPAHRDSIDNQRFARLAAPVVARQLLGSGFHDTLGAIPAALPVRGGPRIEHVYRQSGDTLILTVRHDAGTDLQVPLQAQAGAGFAVMDGGSISATRTDTSRDCLQPARCDSPSASAGVGTDQPEQQLPAPLPLRRGGDRSRKLHHGQLRFPNKAVGLGYCGRSRDSMA